MKMLSLVVQRGKTLQYPSGRGKFLREGECFQASERDAKFLVLLGKAQIDPAPQDGDTGSQESEVAAGRELEFVEGVMGLKRQRGRPRKAADALRTEA